MKKAGIVLIILEAFAIGYGISSGEAAFLHINGAADVFESLGNLLPGIIGIILFIKGKKKEADKETKAVPVSLAGNTGAAKKTFCSKCGAAAEPEDVYCIQCGSMLKKK